MWLECDKSGQCRVRGFGIRQSSSRKDDCPLEIIANRSSEMETWTIDIKCNEHNHPPTPVGWDPARVGGWLCSWRRTYCEGVESTCLGAARWRVAKRQVARKLMGSGRKLRKVLIGSHSPVSRSSFRQLHTVLALLFCLPSLSSFGFG